MMTWADFFAFCMLIIALLRFFLSIIDRMNKKKEVTVAVESNGYL